MDKHRHCEMESGNENTTAEARPTEKLIESPEERNDDTITKPRPLDGGWGWMCVIGLFIHTFITVGTMRSFTIVYIELIERYHKSAVATSWVASLRGCSAGFFAFFSSALCNRFSSRSLSLIGGLMCATGTIVSAYAPRLEYLYFTYGICLGIGSALVNAPAQLIVNSYFEKKKSRALGLGTMGAGAGSFALPPLLAILFSNYAFSGALLLIGAINLHMWIGSMLYRPLADNYPGLKKEKLVKVVARQKRIRDTVNNDLEKSASLEGPLNEYHGKSKHDGKTKVKSHKTERHTEKKSPLFHLSLCKDIRFVTFSLALIFTMTGASNIVFLASFGRELGFDLYSISILVAVHGASDMLGRFGFGFLLDSKYFRSHKAHAFYVVVCLCGVFQTIISFVRTFPVVLILLIFRGMFITMIGQKITLLSDILERDKVASANGFASLNQGIGMLLGPLLGGMMKDYFGSYKYSLRFGGVCIMFSAVLLCLIFNINRCVHQRRRQSILITNQSVPQGPPSSLT